MTQYNVIKASDINASLNAKLSISDFASYILNYVYPIGSIYMSLSNVSPASFLGGGGIDYQKVLRCGQLQVD